MTETPDPAPRRAARAHGPCAAQCGARQRADPPGDPAAACGIVLALLVVLVVLFAFDRFLASMQRFLDLPVGDPEPTATEPVVTEPR